ncbi:MAG TPA: hypothetical protein DCR43_07570 [Bacteroidales bacterium]|nr:MAG: hypothetical protein A2X09_07470 [Bacteroidetes bacterium GWF2_43_11]PKP25266.1 MAG: hypothetical protein CVU06_04265 [Bacteroidetes bacterium HGW-Bacteroidetes-22]HAQ65693.1 hypothetical protein [Bacteroidales bacterium]HBZ66025.1 hypothetical protein [Bacteroidales bacterium]
MLQAEKHYSMKIFRNGRFIATALLFASIWPSVVAVAQEEIKQAEEVTIIGDFSPKITEANKIMKSPEVQDTVIGMPAMQYSIISVPWQMHFPVSDIQPLKNKPEPDVKYLRNYARLGFGNYTTPYLEFFAGKTQSKSNAVGLHFRHLSSQGDGDGIFQNGFSFNDVDIYGKIITRSYAINIDGAYNRHGIHYYGFDTTGLAPGLVPSEDSLKQAYNRFSAGISFTSQNTRRGSLNHAFGARFAMLTDHYSTNELNFKLNFEADADVNLFDGSQKQKLGMLTDFNYFNNQWAIATSTNSSLLNLRPFYMIEFAEYSLWLGGNIEMSDDSSSAWHIYPEARAGVNVIKDVLEVYAGIRGGQYRNSFDRLTRINPYVIRELPLKFSNSTFELYGGFHSSFSRFIDFSGTFSSGKVENMALYYNPAPLFQPGNLMSVVYDDVTLMRISAEFSYQKKDIIRLIFGGAYQSSRPTKETHAWYTPEIEGWLSGDINISPELKIKASAKFFSKMYARVDTLSNNLHSSPIGEKIIKIDPYLDLGVGAEYRFNPRFSVFLDINNLLASRYEYWYNYKHYGINVLGGITFGF